MLERYATALASCGVHRLEAARDRACLAEFYRDVPIRYPASFEALCLSYWWTEAELGEVELAANPAGSDLQGLAESVRYDPYLWPFLATHGYLIIGRMSGGRYDPCAFDMNRQKQQDAPLVRVDHEEILSFERLGRPSGLAASFEALLDESLEGGRRTRR